MTPIPALIPTITVLHTFRVIIIKLSIKSFQILFFVTIYSARISPRTALDDRRSPWNHSHAFKMHSSRCIIRTENVEIPLAIGFVYIIHTYIYILLLLLCLLLIECSYSKYGRFSTHKSDLICAVAESSSPASRKFVLASVTDDRLGKKKYKNNLRITHFSATSVEACYYYYHYYTGTRIIQPRRYVDLSRKRYSVRQCTNKVKV